MQAGYLLLCGGQSVRMGVNKAMLLWQGQTLLDRAAAAGTGFHEKIFSSNDINIPIPAGFKGVSDIIPSTGALGGIYSALCVAESDVLVVSPCDMPFYTSEIIRYLAEQSLIHGGATTALLDREGRSQPLMAVYPKTAAEVIRKQLDSGQYKLRAILNKLNPVYITPPVYASDRLFININTPQEWAELQTFK